MELVRKTWLPTLLFACAGFVYPLFGWVALATTPLLWRRLIGRGDPLAGAGVGALNAAVMLLLVSLRFFIPMKIAARSPGYGGEADFAVGLLIIFAWIFGLPIGALLGALAAALQPPLDRLFRRA